MFQYRHGNSQCFTYYNRYFNYLRYKLHHVDRIGYRGNNQPLDFGYYKYGYRERSKYNWDSNRRCGRNKCNYL